MTLDEMYGPCLPADRDVWEWEQFNQPDTLRTLNSASGAELADYMTSVIGRPFAELLANTTGIIWVVDEHGEIHFAEEEARLEEDLSLAFVFPRKYLKLPGNLVKFGHPALLPPGLGSTKVARCGGDITYDPGLGSAHTWVIRFQSGRYGNLRKHLTLGMLQSVAKRFAEYGVYVSPIHDKDSKIQDGQK